MKEHRGVEEFIIMRLPYDRPPSGQMLSILPMPFHQIPFELANLMVALG